VGDKKKMARSSSRIAAAAAVSLLRFTWRRSFQCKSVLNVRKSNPPLLCMNSRKFATKEKAREGGVLALVNRPYFSAKARDETMPRLTAKMTAMRARETKILPARRNQKKKK